MIDQGREHSNLEQASSQSLVMRKRLWPGIINLVEQTE